LFTLQVALFCVVWAIGIRDSFNVESVKFIERQTTPWTKSSISPQALFDGVRLWLEKLPRIQWTIFVATHSGGPNLVFHWSAAWPRWQPLWWGKISFQNFRSLNLGLCLCVDFPSSSELIAYVDLMDSCEIWPKCFFDISNIFPFTRSQFTKIPKYSICQLQNRFSRQPIRISKKPHTPLQSYSPTDWNCAVCLIVSASSKAGNSV